MQTAKESLLEAITNTALGLMMAFLVNAVLMLAIGITASATQNVLLVIGHTVVSIIRNYVVRRFFTNRIWLKWRRK